MGEAIGPQIYKRQVRLSRRTALPDCPELFSSSLVSHVKAETHPNEHHHCLLTDPGTGPCANRRGRARAMPVPLQEHFPSAERSRRDVELQLPILRRICSLFPPEPTGMSPRCVCNFFHSPIPIYSPELCQACSPQGNPPQLLTAKGQTRQPHRSLPTLKLVRGARQPTHCADTCWLAVASNPDYDTGTRATSRYGTVITATLFRADRPTARDIQRPTLPRQRPTQHLTTGPPTSPYLRYQANIAPRPRDTPRLCQHHDRLAPQRAHCARQWVRHHPSRLRWRRRTKMPLPFFCREAKAPPRTGRSIGGRSLYWAKGGDRAARAAQDPIPARARHRHRLG